MGPISGQFELFWKIWACLLIDPYQDLVSCEKLGKSYVAFLRKRQYLKFWAQNWANLGYFGQARIFWKFLVCSSYWPLSKLIFMWKITKILHTISEKKANFRFLAQNWTNLGYFGRTRIFWKTWVCSVIDPCQNLVSCKISRKSYVSFLRKSFVWTYGQRQFHRSLSLTCVTNKINFVLSPNYFRTVCDNLGQNMV